MIKSFARMAVAVSLSVPVLAHASVVAVSFPGNILSVDTDAGTVGYLSAGTFLNALSQGAQPGQLWSVTMDTNRLAQIDATTGAVTLGPAISGIQGDVSIRGLAYTGGLLYAVHNQGGMFKIGADDLYTINTSTGAATLVGSTGFTGVQGLTTDAGGNMFAWDAQRGLLRVNKATGAATDVGAAPGGVDIQTLAFDPNGVLYGAGYHIYTIDPVTGQRTLSTQMSTFVDIRGIEFISAVPEPSAIALLLAGAGVVAVSARRRKMAA